MEAMYEGIGFFFFIAGCILAYWGRAYVIVYERKNRIPPHDKEKSNDR